MDVMQVGGAPGLQPTAEKLRGSTPYIPNKYYYEYE